MKSFSLYILFPFLILALSLKAVAQQKLSLRDAVDLAKRNNPELKAAHLEVESAQEQKRIARSLFLPTVNAVAQVNHYFELTPFFGFGETSSEGKIPYGRFGGEDQLTAGLVASQPLFNPLASPTMQQARLQEEESGWMLTSQQVNTLSQVKQTYLLILVLNERIELQYESINRNQRALQDARSLFLQGKGLRVDTLRAYTSVRNLEPDLMKLQDAVKTSQLQLKALVGIDSLQVIELTDSLFLPAFRPIPTEDEVYTTAKASNADIQLVVLKEQLSDQQAKIASAARLPTLSAVGLYQVNTQTTNMEYGNAYYPTSSFVGIQLSVPIFTGFSNQAKVRQADLAGEQARLRSKNTHDELRVVVHQAVANAHESLARLETTRDVQEAAELSYSIVQYRYQKGISSRLELTDAEFALSTAQSNYLETVYDYWSAQIDLQRIMGRVE